MAAKKKVAANKGSAKKRAVKKSRKNGNANGHGSQFDQTFKGIDNVLRQEAGCSSELDYTEQTSWLLFLKYLDDFEQERTMEAVLRGKFYESIIDEPHQWSSWAAPRKTYGTFDHDHALTGDDLIVYINDELFPYLQGFKGRASSPAFFLLPNRFG